MNSLAPCTLATEKGVMPVKRQASGSNNLTDEFLGVRVLQAVLDRAPQGIIIADDQGVIRYVNPAYSNLCGYSASERIGQSVFVTNPAGALARALRTGRPVENSRYKTAKTGIMIVASAYPLYFDGRLAGGVIFFQDASEVAKLSSELRRASAQAKTLSDKISGLAKAKATFADLIGDSKTFRRTVELAMKIAQSDSNVLLRGETGTGKELFAQAIHNASPRAERPFVAVNCAAIPETLLESEFFGYEKGAFTGAAQRKIGAFELADTGTIFLDEIGDMSLALQAKLLRVLQNGEFWRLGGREPIRTNVRIIAATNRSLEDMISRGLFRRDLYYRLNVVEIHLPPLRNRKSDIPLLADCFLERISRKLGKARPVLSPAALEALQNYHWPGNVRELENVLERAVNLVEGQVITPEVLLLPEDKGDEMGGDDIVPLKEMERIMIRRALSKFGTDLRGKKQAARALRISLTTLYSRLREMNEG